MGFPVPSWRNNNDTVEFSTDQSFSQPIDFGTLVSGSVDNAPIAAHNPVHLWNDMDGSGDSVDMETVTIAVRDVYGTATGQVVNGTDGNGNIGLLKAKSNGVSGVGIADDAQAAFTRLDSSVQLNIGDIPKQCARHLHFTLDCPTDVVPGLNQFTIRVLYSYA